MWLDNGEDGDDELSRFIFTIKHFAKFNTLSDHFICSWDQSIKLNHFNFGLSKCKQNKYVMHDVVAQGGIITATDQMLNIKKFFLHLPVRWDNRSETRFKTLCMLIRSQTLVSDESLRLRSQWKIKWPTAIKSSRAQSYKSTAHYH